MPNERIIVAEWNTIAPDVAPSSHAELGDSVRRILEGVLAGLAAFYVGFHIGMAIYVFVPIGIFFPTEVFAGAFPGFGRLGGKRLLRARDQLRRLPQERRSRAGRG